MTHFNAVIPCTDIPPEWSLLTCFLTKLSYAFFNFFMCGTNPVHLINMSSRVRNKLLFVLTHWLMCDSESQLSQSFTFQMWNV